MKPDQARRMQKAREAQRAALGDALMDFAGDKRQVVVDLIPKAEDLEKTLKTMWKLVRQTERTPRGPRRNKKLDELMLLVGRVVYLERVMALEPLERAGLTPFALFELSKMAPSDIVARVKVLNGQEPPKKPSGLILPGGGS